MDDVLILSALHVACPLSGGALTSTSSLMRYDGAYYAHDARLETIENSLAHPANLSESHQHSQQSCPTVPRSFLNAASCALKQTCAPIAFSAMPIMLNQSTLHTFAAVGEKYVYALEGLRLDEDSGQDTSPCSSASRWRRLGASCGAHGGATALDGATKATLAGVIRGSDMANQIVRDVARPDASATCTAAVDGVSATGARVQVDGSCWEHVHPDLLSVYDFTYWSVAHPGNAEFGGGYNPITAIARAGATALHYPSSHNMYRWKTEGTASSFPRLGKLGDVVDFALLPSAVQTFDIASAFGAVGERSGGQVEACGSPGEVANAPELGHRYAMQLMSSDVRDSSLGPTACPRFAACGDEWGGVSVSPLLRRYDPVNAKSMVHNTIALRADDQLRQRVAWALAQIYVIGTDGLGKEAQVEVWVAWYDIFVRHSFGNLRDLLHEISYSPMMATYLTFRGSRSLAASGAAPDENYARELMQLFTLGIFALNADGTQQTDGNGVPIETYDNDDITTYARAWTGFDLSPWRGNLESPNGAQSTNFIDPMTVTGGYRDAFPYATSERPNRRPRQPLSPCLVCASLALCSALSDMPLFG